MNKSRHWALVAAVVVSWNCLSGLAQAQAPVGAALGQPASAPRLALLDVGRIFKNHVRFKAMMEAMKADVEREEKQVKADRSAINTLGEKLQEYRKGTVEYKQLEEELAKRQADLAVRVQLRKNEFLQREAKIYHSVYQEILQITDYFARQHQIDMVLRFNGEEVDVERPDSVLSFINKPVVWYDRGLDITEAILTNVNRGAVSPGQADHTTPMRPGVPFSR